MTRAYRCLLPVLLLWLVAAASHSDDMPERTRYDRVAAVDKTFVDVMLDLEQAIGDHNFRIVARSDIGTAVRQRGHADFPDTAIVHFCNLAYARRVIEIDPGLILYMPCRIAVFVDGDRVHATSLLLPTDTGQAAFDTLAKEINAQIRDIVDAAVDPWGSSSGS